MSGVFSLVASAQTPSMPSLAPTVGGTGEWTFSRNDPSAENVTAIATPMGMHTEALTIAPATEVDAERITALARGFEYHSRRLDKLRESERQRADARVQLRPKDVEDMFVRARMAKQLFAQGKCDMPEYDRVDIEAFRRIYSQRLSRDLGADCRCGAINFTRWEDPANKGTVVHLAPLLYRCKKHSGRNNRFEFKQWCESNLAANDDLATTDALVSRIVASFMAKQMSIAFFEEKQRYRDAQLRIDNGSNEVHPSKEVLDVGYLLGPSLIDYKAVERAALQCYMDRTAIAKEDKERAERGPAFVPQDESDDPSNATDTGGLNRNREVPMEPSIVLLCKGMYRLHHLGYTAADLLFKTPEDDFKMMNGGPVRPEPPIRPAVHVPMAVAQPRSPVFDAVDKMFDADEANDVCMGDFSNRNMDVIRVDENPDLQEIAADNCDAMRYLFESVRL